jgi:hypothetical protein
MSAIFRVAVFSARKYDRDFLSGAARAARTDEFAVAFDFVESRLTADTAHLLLSSSRTHATDGEDDGATTSSLSSQPHIGVCAFINDDLSRAVLATLKEAGVAFVALRSAGYNKVDLVAAKELGLRVRSLLFNFAACLTLPVSCMLPPRSFAYPNTRRKLWPSTQWPCCWRWRASCRAR